VRVHHPSRYLFRATKEADGVLEIQLGGITRGIGFDQLVVTGSAIFHGTLNVSIIPGFTPQTGQVFTIITHNVGTYTFDEVILPALSGGLSLDIGFSDPEVTLTVIEDNIEDGFQIFLPLIMH
jgi:hypothetical protein